jgi:hypothetical protein
MIKHWWRRDFGREPDFEDLSDAQRVVVLAQVLPIRSYWDFGVNVFLALWIVGAIVGIVGTQYSAVSFEGPLFAALTMYILLPAYAIALRKKVLARAVRRATLRTMRDDRLETIRSIIDSH